MVVSRGELVEIGGAFRIPDIMRQAGCTLVEVGSTNRTHLKDYEQAITENTAAIMKVHTSNYHISGFTASVDEARLGQLCRERGVALISDLGSGSLTDLRRFGLKQERRRTRLVMKEPKIDIDNDVVTLSFFLPPGAYATTIMRELIHYTDLTERVDVSANRQSDTD